MGIQISDILPKQEIELNQLLGKRIAVDAFLWLHQFLSIIRQPDGTPLMDSKGRVTSHLSGVFYRSAKLLEKGIRLVWVFDGPKPKFKEVTTVKRAALREQAKTKWQQALEAGKLADARTAAQATLGVTEEIINQSKELLDYMGIPVVQAPSEGEAQCAYMTKEKLAYATASQDTDSLLFGTPMLVRNLSITGKRKLPRQETYIEVKPELIELDKVLRELGINRGQLIVLGMLVGTDYNPGIKGIGPKRALELVKKEKTLNNILKKIEWNCETPAEQIYDFFQNPPIDKKVKIKFSEPQPEKILNFMVNEFEFSQERVEKVIKTLQESKIRQTSLESWLK